MAWMTAATRTTTVQAVARRSEACGMTGSQNGRAVHKIGHEIESRDGMVTECLVKEWRRP